MQDYQPLFDNIGRYVELDEDDRQEFIAIIRKAFVKRRQFLAQPGFVCTHQSYVLSGAFRAYLVNNEGIEHTIKFAIEDWFISDFDSFIHQTPASFFVEALEDSTVLQFAHHDLDALCSRNHKYERYFRITAQKAFTFAQKRILSTIAKTAEQRYLEFSEQYPDIVQRVPQYALASYLGMTPEFLSKIRNNMRGKYSLKQG